MIKPKWKRTLSAVAPALAGALGGPLAGAAAKAIGGVFLGEGREFDEDMIAEAIMGADQDKLLLLKEADNNFKATMQELDVKDRSSARDMAKSTSIAPQIILSVLYTVGYFLLLYAFATGKVVIADNVKSEFNMVLGVLTAAQIQILNFWFGSSSGSKEKTNKLR